jgi:hypothetical protein
MCQIYLAGNHCSEAEKKKEINDVIAANQLAVVMTK